MSRVITFSRSFPAYHPKAGQPTHFVEQIWSELGIEDAIGNIAYHQLMSLNPGKEKEARLVLHSHTQPFNYKGKKKHTIRAGKRFKAGDHFSPRVWSGKPYTSRQVTIAPHLKIKMIYDFKIEVDADYICLLIDNYPFYEENGSMVTQVDALKTLAKNDGLELQDFKDWFKWGTPFDGQIISWSGDEGY